MKIEELASQIEGSFERAADGLSLKDYAELAEELASYFRTVADAANDDLKRGKK